ncbi:4-cytidine 5'-diphospho-2-C-methyl-D-erythritol kinase [Asticcacaulis biprosthecium C19]|uniref:4-diphosphocytidyl-2-C-methyl-D-erythritol kinase n=1 Tax=Asticcacaulis biprosthecium C19 TaxID=715226 RepID=F4QRB1_9CAUL|nr:4-(cytidine 5'-diphospho)-2-C-methyl-D-erythritol kinase [Asticcacaulis biprosthecium]EGF90748.1 4-cytidine 5'-diphospho-2-C-methyl-D-erythritol kinase [Asticcacaulis biprosthecium C19]
MTASRLAPAKVNLYLHVAAPDARRYHPLQSLVMFADIGDELRLTTGKGLTIDGPFSAGLSTGDDNLILKAVRRFEAAAGIKIDTGLHLVKSLPVASGLGGGSADAGAALHLLRAAFAPDMSDTDLEAVAAGIGADGVMCLWNRSSFAEGYGEILTPVVMPELPCVLINPRVECATAAVYNGFDHLARFDDIEARALYDGSGDVVDALRNTRNDLEPAAIRLQPVIADVLTSLDAQPQTLLARMSGSGATCFALCATPQAAERLSHRMQALWPAAWVQACTLR